LKAGLKIGKKVGPKVFKLAKTAGKKGFKLAKTVGKKVGKQVAKQLKEKKNKKVVHPDHYNQGKIECWDYIIDHKMDFLTGNCIKYLTRFADKNVPWTPQRGRFMLVKLTFDL
jgi:hypothetical protein